MTDATKALERLGGDVKSSWQRFLDVFAPLRPELYRYCRRLTNSAWDAEDLVQEAMARAFVQLGTFFHEPPEPRAWLLRVASNSWIDRARREKLASRLERTEDAPPTDPRASREAAGTLLVALAPQERVALVLKDVFDFSLEEIAGVLGTTVGAVKAALHRGRGRLERAEQLPPRAPAPGVLEAFANAFNERDVERLTALLLDSASVEIVGLVTEYGQDQPKDPYTGSFTGTLSPIVNDERGGVAPELLADYLGSLPSCELRAFRDAWVLLFWYDHAPGPAVRGVMTLEAEGDRIARVRNYFFSPDVIAEICQELNVPYRSNGYRYWYDSPRA